MMQYSVSRVYRCGRQSPELVRKKQNLTAQRPALAAPAYFIFKQYLLLTLFVIACLAALGSPLAYAQIGVGFNDNGWYTGTIGHNKGGADAYKCPNGTVLRGLFHADKLNPYNPMISASGMTAQVSLYCALVTLDAGKKARAYPLTPNGKPTVEGYRYAGIGGQQHNYCDANDVITRIRGTSRKSDPSYPYWASSLGAVCRPLRVISGDWVALATDNNWYIRYFGDAESRWPHYWTDWFCPIAADNAVNGLYRQSGGEGWDGINIYCAVVRQARHSARIEFQNFAWKKTLGPDGWLVGLTKDGRILEQQIYDGGEYKTISGKDKRAYSNFEGTDNNPQQFQYDYELYVLPGKGYGANISHRPENIPEQSYRATSTCISTIALENHEDKTCELLIVGRPDIAVSVTVPKDAFVDPGDTKTVTVSGVNLGAGDAKGTAGFTLDVDIPNGWTAEAVPGCTVSGRKVSCRITKDLAEAKDWGEKGGDISFTFPITSTINAQGNKNVVTASLGRSVPDAGGKPENSDFNKENDVATGKMIA